MKPKTLREIEEIYHAALEQPPGQRIRFLREVCGENTELCKEIESLLAEAPDADRLFETPAWQQAASLLIESGKPGLTRFTAGVQLGPYQIIHLLGAGGMGEVYRARDMRLGREVALKLLPQDELADPERRRRFLQEARAASALNHPHIVTFFDLASAEGQDFLVMEYIAGQTLDRVIPQKGLQLREALSYAIQIADALAAAHAVGIVHRDLKPANILVSDSNTVKLLDFGIAKLIEPGPAALSAGETATAHTAPHTSSGLMVGTLSYMSPEQAEGKPVDARSDIFSFGCVMYEMITGQHPFRGDSPSATLSAILRNDPQPPSAWREHVPSGLEKIILRCLRKNPQQRFQSASDLQLALLDFQEKTAAGTRKRQLATRLLITGITILAFSVIWLFTHISRSTSSSAHLRSLAVLPFENLSRESGQEFFADGMTQQLITELSNIRTIRVTSRSSAMQYQGERKSVPQIARELGVEGLVEGSVFRSANKVRITAQLIDARREEHLWAESYDRDLSEVLGLQREVARAIANKIQATLTPSEQARLSAVRPVDPQVQDLVLRGQYYGNKGGEQNLKEAIRYFDQAIARDATYAPAYVGLASAYGYLIPFLPPRDIQPKAKTAAERALQLDETLADAHAQLAKALLYYEWNWPQAEKELKRALELNPSNADAHLMYFSYFNALGRPQDALSEIRLAQRLDPLSLNVQFHLLLGLLDARQFDAVIEQAERDLAREPDFVYAYVMEALAYGEKRQFEKALAAIEKANKVDRNAHVIAMTAHVQAASGNRREALKLLGELKALSTRRYVCAYEVAHSYVKLGDKDRAFEYLEKGKRERADCMVWLLTEPWMDPLRSDPRYQKLIEYIGLATGKAGQRP